MGFQSKEERCYCSLQDIAIGKVNTMKNKVIIPNQTAVYTI